MPYGCPSVFAIHVGALGASWTCLLHHKKVQTDTEYRVPLARLPGSTGGQHREVPPLQGLTRGMCTDDGAEVSETRLQSDFIGEVTGHIIAKMTFHQPPSVLASTLSQLDPTNAGYSLI